jgi:sRNA-binding carbon storage regulator CsrA
MKAGERVYIGDDIEILYLGTKHESSFQPQIRVAISAPLSINIAREKVKNKSSL